MGQAAAMLSFKILTKKTGRKISLLFSKIGEKVLKHGRIFKS